MSRLIHRRCGPDYLAFVQSICCAAPDGTDTCGGGTPTTCSGSCGTMFLDYYDNCAAAGTNQPMDDLATACRASVRFACTAASHCLPRVAVQAARRAVVGFSSLTRCGCPQFARCNSRRPSGSGCAAEAACVPILDDLTCSKPPCEACICP